MKRLRLGAGGGLINVASASSTASSTLTISNTIGSNAKLTANVLNITTNGYVFAKAVASNDGGGAISVGNSDATATVTATNTVTINSNATLTATDDLTVKAYTELRPSVKAATNQGGLVGLLVTGIASSVPVVVSGLP